MGEPQFTPEELAILGETESGEPDILVDEQAQGEKEAPADTETETIPAKETLEAEPEEDAVLEEDRIPKSRFDKVYGQAKEFERKLDLLRKDPEAYYNLYPDDKPETPSQRKQEISDVSTLANMEVRGGQYNGWKLQDLKAEDPDAYLDLVMGYKEQQFAQMIDRKLEERERTRKEEAQRKEILAESERETKEFAEFRAKESYQKSFDALSEKEQKNVYSMIDKTIKWMSDTGRGAGILADGFYLMNRETDIAKAKMDGAKHVVDAVSKTPTLHVAGNKESDKAIGYETYLDYTTDQMTNIVQKMNDRQFLKFIKDAPESLRQKFPKLPWE